MSTSDSIQLALKAVQSLNSVKQQLRGTAQSCARTLSELDSMIVNPEKLLILQDGLEGLSVNSGDLNTEKNNLQAICTAIIEGVPELTS